MAEDTFSDSDSRISLTFVDDDASSTESLLSIDGNEGHTATQQVDATPTSAATQAAKAIEAAGGNDPDVLVSDPDLEPAPRASPSRLPTWADEHTPLLDAGPAPPDYAAATAWRMALPSAQIGQNSQGHATPLQYADEAAHNPLSRNGDIVVGTKARKARRCLRLLSLVTALTVFTSILSVILSWTDSAETLPLSQRIAALDHPHSDECPYSWYSEYKVFTFDNISSFGFADISDAADYPKLRISGDLNMFPAPPEQEAAVEIWVSIAMTAPWEVAKLRFTEEWTGLLMLSPLFWKANNHSEKMSLPCMHTWVGIFVRSDAIFDGMEVWAGYMNFAFGYRDTAQDVGGQIRVEGQHHLDLKIADRATIATSSGNIDARYLNVANLFLETQCGDVSGTYALHNELLIKSQTGAVNIAVHPTANGKFDQVHSNFSVKAKLDARNAWFPIVEPEGVLESFSQIQLESGYPYVDAMPHMLGYLRLRFRNWFSTA